MKRHGNLWENLISFESLYLAAEKAKKGKRFRPAVSSFHFDQERKLWKLHEELSKKTYGPGNYRSFFSNVYFDALDHFVKERLGMRGYVRYVDDFLVFSDDKRRLHDVRERVKDFLVYLRLRLHPHKSVIFPVKSGIRFLGYRVFATHRLLAKENVRRFRRRARRMQRDYAGRRTTIAEIRRRLMSWLRHARQADTHRLVARLLGTIVFQRATAD